MAVRAAVRGPGTGLPAALEAATRPRQVAAALQGLDEDHDDALPVAAVPFLAHPASAVRRAAAQAIGHRADADGILHHQVPLI